VTDPLTALVPALEVDERVVGLILGGSRGKGLGVDQSDWDLYLVLADGVAAAEVLPTLDLSHPRLDVCSAMTVAELAAHAEVGTSEEWNRYNFAHLVPVVDKTHGELQRICDAKEFLPEAVTEPRAAALLDAYVNSYYRSLKNARDGDQPASRLDAAESVARLIGFAFCAEQRVAPYNKFLAWELGTHPLRGAWFPPRDAVSGLLEILSTGGVRAQAAQFVRVEAQAREFGHAAVLEAWGEWSLQAMRSGDARG
jgi:hypothetical protein